MHFGRLLMIVLIPMALAATADMYIFAVTQDGKGLPARLIVEVLPGSGNVSLTLNSIVGPDTQESINNAIRAAVNLRGERFESYDYKVTIKSNAKELSGPSAGLPIALAVYAALGGEDIPDNISATGTIDRFGYVGKVGGIYEKLKAAREVNVTLFLIPFGERYVSIEGTREVEPGIRVPSATTIDIYEVAKEWNMEVYEVKTLEEAVDIVFKGKRPEVNIPEEAVVPEINFIPEEASPSYKEPLISSVESLLEELNRAVNFECLYEEKDSQTVRESARTYLERARLVLNLGYIYTAGNYAFLGLVSVSTLNEICLHPSILNTSSLVYQEYRERLEDTLDSLRQRAQRITLTRDNLDALAGARQRIIRAETALTNTDLRMLKSAEYWLKTAKVLLDYAEKHQEEPLVGDYKNQARLVISNVEDMLSIKDNPNVRERVEWAKMAYERGWYAAALMEAALAKGIYIAQNTRESVLRDKVEALLDSVEGKGAWSEAYKLHGYYYYQAAGAYRGKNRDMEIQMLRTALQMLEAASEIDRMYKIGGSVKVVKKELNNDLMFYSGVVLLILAIVLLIASLSGGKKRDRKVEVLLRVRKELEKVNDGSLNSVISAIDRKIRTLSKGPSPRSKSSRHGRGKHQ